MKAEELLHLRGKYKDRMLQIAFVASGWSPQPEGQRHGCVLAVDGKFIVAVAYNGPDRGWQPPRAAAKCACPECTTPPVVHAEVNALLNLEKAGVQAGPLVAFMTKRPCEPCFDALEGRGVAAMFWLQDCSGIACGWARGQERPRRFGEYGG